MTPSAYLSRRVKRLEQKFGRDVDALFGEDLLRRTSALLQAQCDLVVWVEEKVRPSVTTEVWREKRRGGPYRLDFPD